MFQDLAEKIKQEKKRHKRGVYDCFVFVACSHGKLGELIMVDGQRIEIEKEIVEPFDSFNWSVYAGKPKVFLFQCCRNEGKSATFMLLLILRILNTCY